MSNLIMWSLIVSAAVPFVVAFINREKWQPIVKVVCFFVVSCIAAAGTAYFQGDLTGKRWLDAVLIILVAGGSFYRTLKPAGVDLVEKKTG